MKKSLLQSESILEYFKKPWIVKLGYEKLASISGTFH